MVTNDCMAKGCERSARAKGLCMSHYQQQRRGQTLGPLRQYNNDMHRDENGRGCTKCGEDKSWSEFHDRTKSKCKACTASTKQ